MRPIRRSGVCGEPTVGSIAAGVSGAGGAVVDGAGEGGVSSLADSVAAAGAEGGDGAAGGGAGVASAASEPWSESSGIGSAGGVSAAGVVGLRGGFGGRVGSGASESARPSRGVSSDCGSGVEHAASTEASTSDTILSHLLIGDLSPSRAVLGDCVQPVSISSKIARTMQ